MLKVLPSGRVMFQRTLLSSSLTSCFPLRAVSHPTVIISNNNNNNKQLCCCFSDSSSWNKKQIDKIERKFKKKDAPTNDINNDDDLQQMWKEMERRVVNRRPRTIRETHGKTGRTNIRKTDEEMWLKSGLYEKESENASSEK